MATVFYNLAADCFSEHEALTSIFGLYRTSTSAPLSHFQPKLAPALSIRSPQRESFLYYIFYHEIYNHHHGSGYSIRPVID